VKLSRVVISNDPRNAERCHAQTGRSVDHHWWSSATILPPDPSVHPPRQPFLAVTFGFLSGLKTLGLVHDALRLVRTRFPALRWRIIGPFEPSSNPDHAALAERIAPDASWVEFTGAISDHARLRSLLAEAHVMLLPFADGASTRRGTLHVAWAFGLPVVTTPPPVASEAIVDGENALLVPEPVPSAWTDTIVRVLTDAALEERLRAGSLEAAERFSWKRLAERHLEMYDGLIVSPASLGVAVD
jgi:glycosyltransferase involved in cell wall biosynthesis